MSESAKGYKWYNNGAIQIKIKGDKPPNGFVLGMLKGVHSGAKNGMYGKHRNNSGSKNGMYGKHHSAETRHKIAQKLSILN